MTLVYSGPDLAAPWTVYNAANSVIYYMQGQNADMPNMCADHILSEKGEMRLEL